LGLVAFGADHHDVARRLGEFSRRGGGFLLVSYHTASLAELGHYHIVHSCTNATRCRCFQYGFGTIFGRRDFVAEEKVTDFSEAHWRNLYLYLEKGDGYRLLIFFQNTFNSKPEVVLQPGALPLGCGGRSGEDAVSYQGTAPSLVGESCPAPRGSFTYEGGMGARGTKRRIRIGPQDIFEAAQDVARLGWTLWTTSVSALLRRHEVNKKYPEILVMARKALEEQASNAIILQFDRVKEWGFHDFMTELTTREPGSVTWGVPAFVKYMNIEDSADVIIRMMEHNAQNIPKKDVNGQVTKRDGKILYWDGKELFLDFVQWFNRARDKVNTQCLVGTSNSGKSWFCNAWVKMAVYVGKISNPNRSESAPFSGAMESRIMFWDEADIGMEQNFADVCKMILGGQEASVNIKYKNRQDILPAPMLMCANRNPNRAITKDDRDAINNRWHYIEWSITEEIRSLLYGQCNPMALFKCEEWATNQLVEEGPDNDIYPYLLTPDELSLMEHAEELEKLEILRREAESMDIIPTEVEEEATNHIL
jgi:hypothetical protein